MTSANPSRQLLDLGPAKGSKIRSSSNATVALIDDASASSVDARTIIWKSQPAVADVVFVVDQRTSWGEDNLLRVVAKGAVPDADEMAAVRGALARVDSRKSEDVDAWADTLGTKLAAFND